MCQWGTIESLTHLACSITAENHSLFQVIDFTENSEIHKHMPVKDLFSFIRSRMESFNKTPHLERE